MKRSPKSCRLVSCKDCTHRHHQVEEEDGRHRDQEEPFNEVDVQPANFGYFQVRNHED